MGDEAPRTPPGEMSAKSAVPDAQATEGYVPLSLHCRFALKLCPFHPSFLRLQTTLACANAIRAGNRLHERIAGYNCSGNPSLGCYGLALLIETSTAILLDGTWSKSNVFWPFSPRHSLTPAGGSIVIQRQPLLSRHIWGETISDGLIHHYTINRPIQPSMSL